MVSTWAVLGLGTAVVATVVVPGVLLWWPSRGERASRSDLGVALMTGTVIAFAVLAVQVLFELRLSRLEEDRAAAQASRDAAEALEADRRDLSMTIGLSRDLRGIDLRARDLSGFYMAKKDLRGVQFIDARLENAVLWKANLEKADLRGARLNGAMLDDAALTGAWLSRADLRGASLRGAKLRGADLSRADLRSAELQGARFAGAALDGADLRGARYDRSTTWPAGFRMSRCRYDVCTVVDT